MTWIIQPETKAIRDVIVSLDDFQQWHLLESLPVVTDKFPGAVEHLISLILGDHQQQLAGELLTRGARGGAEEPLAEDGTGGITPVNLERVVRLAPVQHGLDPTALAVIGGEGTGEQDGTAEQGLRVRVKVAEEQGRGQVVGAGTLAQGDHLVWITAVLGNVSLDPLQGGGNILCAVGEMTAL